VTAARDKPDLDCREHIDRFVDLFYERLLAHEELSPIFLDVAQIDLAQHLPHIKAYWYKLLLGQKSYQRHTMSIHRELHARRPLRREDFEAWLALFSGTVDANFAGPYAERAKTVAASIAANMAKTLPARNGNTA